MLSQFNAGGIKQVLGDPTRTDLLETCARLPSDFVQAPFSFADFTLYPFAVINHTHEYNYMYRKSCESSWSITKPGGRLP